MIFLCFSNIFVNTLFNIHEKFKRHNNFQKTANDFEKEHRDCLVIPDLDSRYLLLEVKYLLDKLLYHQEMWRKNKVGFKYVNSYLN